MKRPTILWRLALLLALLAAGTSHGQDATVSWRNDYSAVRDEAASKRLPILIDFISNNCLHCDKLDRYTFSDARVANLLKERFIPIKINVSNDPSLAAKLSVDRYPTLVIAASDGKVLNTLIGYLDAAALTKELQDTLAKIPLTPQERFTAALQSKAAGEYMHAVSHLREIINDDQAQTLAKHARELLSTIEKSADDRLKQARRIHASGKTEAALEVYAEVWRKFPTLPAGKEARDRINVLAQHNVKAREIIKHDFVPIVTPNQAHFGMWPYGRSLQAPPLGLMHREGDWLRWPVPPSKTLDYDKVGR